jgi:hypothetical protein
LKIAKGKGTVNKNANLACERDEGWSAIVVIEKMADSKEGWVRKRESVCVG